MSKIHFTKMHGLGNDYIYVDTNQYEIADPSAASKLWSRYHKGIGSDGLVLIGPSQKADFSMRIFNADGSEAMMCGNASRCIGKYVYDKGLTTKKEIKLETLSGIVGLQLFTDEAGHVSKVRVDMGSPTLADPRFVATPSGKLGGIKFETRDGDLRATFVSMGNPHCVFFVDNAETIDVVGIGREVETHPLFPERINVEFATVKDDGTIRMRVWERGSGVTQACGTGACATAVAAMTEGLADRKVTIEMDGGSLDVEWNETDGHVYMTGSATTVFEGDIEL